MIFLKICLNACTEGNKNCKAMRRVQIFFDMSSFKKTVLHGTNFANSDTEYLTKNNVWTSVYVGQSEKRNLNRNGAEIKSLQ